MKWSAANKIVETLRRDTRLYLPELSPRRGFSSPRVEHLLNMLVREMPVEECYLEVGVLEGRTLESAAFCNQDKTCIGCDPCIKYGIVPDKFPSNIYFFKENWDRIPRASFTKEIGLIFYDGDHSDTFRFMGCISSLPVASELVMVVDDWDRENVRDEAFNAIDIDSRWSLLREMPEYTDGLTTAPHHFGYMFGVSVWGWKK